MVHSISVLARVGVLLCIWGQVQTSVAKESSIRLEFRRAETGSAEGLVQATVAKTGQTIYLHKTAEITNGDIESARIDDENDYGSGPLLELKFTKQGQRKMEKLTKEHREKPLAVLVNGKVISAPVLHGTLSKQAVISGLGKAEVERIVKGLKSK
jgi:preprotein translocase subunit SecD